MDRLTFLRLGKGAVLFFFLFILGFPRSSWAEDTSAHALRQEKAGAFVVTSSRSDISPDLRSLQPTPLKQDELSEEAREIPRFVLPKSLNHPQEQPSDPPSESLAPSGTTQMPTPLFNFDGISNLFGGWPPDTQGDIGTNHYVQWINLHFAVWQLNKVNHTAAMVYGPVPGHTLFQGFGGACEFNNDGDPITLYDPFADRWFMSQFALPYYPYAPFYQCVAVSSSSDPLGPWYRYEYQIPVSKMNDYPKFGVWPNAYFMTVNQFNSGTTSWGGAGVAALERAAMLNGEPARMVYLDLFPVNSNYGGMLPADFDGNTAPPANSPGYFVEWDDGDWFGGIDGLRLWEFHIDWDQPEQAQFGLQGDPNWFIPTADVDPSMCGMLRNCIPQPGTTTKLDAISDRLMYRLQYRNFGGYASLVSNHTIDLDGTDHAGIHWFELRKGTLGTDWSLYQQGIFGPDSANRWMGSAAMDQIGNMALGYSLSSPTIYPSVRYTGRLVGDPPGSMTQGEVSLVGGSGSQTGSNRWGDYSMMGVDPIDDCTFWYTQQYVAQTGSNTWKTRIGAFRFPGCINAAQGTLQGAVVSSAGNNPIPGAQVEASSSVTQTLSTLTDSNGLYSIQVPVGVYTMTASAFGYYPQVEDGVVVFSGTLTTRDFSLDVAPNQVISGTIRDAQTGWPVYAEINPIGINMSPVWSDPATGAYSMTIPAGTSFTLLVESYLDGYASASTEIHDLAGDLTLNFDLLVDEASCSAPGYHPHIEAVFSSDFETDPSGLTISGITSWAWGEITSGPGTAHSGQKGWATGLSGSYSNYEIGLLSLPPLDLSSYSGQTPALGWWQWLESEARYDFASIEASKDGGASWQVVYGPVSGQVDLDWKYHYLTLGPEYAVSDLRIRFRFSSDSSFTYPGWYLDDLEVGKGECLPEPGGMVTGKVLDANTLEGLNEAVVSHENGESHLTFPTPEDPNQADGLYLFFSPVGTHAVTATHRIGYQTVTQTVEVPLNGAVRQDFALPAGWLEFSPSGIGAQIELGGAITRTLTLTNVGGALSSYEWAELRGAFLPSGPVETPEFVVKTFKADLTSAGTLGIPAVPAVPTLDAGQVITSWLAAGVEGSWAAAYEPDNQTVWVSSPSQFWGGEDSLFEFDGAGIPTGRFYPHDMPHAAGPADLAYNWNTGKLWVMNVNTGVANCIYEIDPELGYTGVKICPSSEQGFTISQRGLAYDPFSDTWLAGGWNDLMVHRFDNEGNILSSVNTGLPISGLAYQPETQHLFALTSESISRVFVLDAAQDFTVVGQFQISEGFGSYSGGGLEFDCSGNLWAVDIILNKVFQFESGESAAFCQTDVPWITTQPVSGTLSAHTVQPITLTLDASLSAVDQPGIYNMLLKLREDTPYLIANLPVSMTATAPASWGKLNGTIQSLGYCDSDPHPLEDAQVTIASSQGLTWTLTTNAAGYYQRWLDESGSPFTVTLSAPEHNSIQSAGVMVSGGLTTTLNLDLEWLQSCTSVFPQAIDEVVKFGRQVTATLALDNAGHVETPFLWHEVVDFSSPFVDLDWISINPISGTIPTGPGMVESNVTLNAGSLSITQAGIYNAGLILETQDPVLPYQHIPLTLTVLPLEYGVQLSAPLIIGEGIPGETITYQLTISNTSEGLTDTINLVLDGNTWPAQLESASTGPLASGAAAVIPLEVTIADTVLPGEQDTLSVTAVSLGDPEKTAELSIITHAQEPSADLELKLSAAPDPYPVGIPLTYTVTITNYGLTTAPGVVFVDLLSPRLQYISDSGGCSLDDTLLTCHLGWLIKDGVFNFSIIGIPVRTGILLNQGAVISDAIDPDMSNNFAAILGTAEGYTYFFPWLAVK